jgi:hypothetical protein
MAQGRKGKKRVAKPPRVDEELAQLASVLAEMQLDNNAYGWFRIPWRDGVNAVLLAFGAARIDFDAIGLDTTLPADIDTILDAAPRWDATIYELAGRAHQRLVSGRVNTNATHLFAAALRCVQLKIANSHGGGSVYNEVLIPAFLRVEPAKIESVVLHWRCVDAIGTSPTLKGDRNDRQRAAFTTAWKRGLYLAAYAIPPAF